MKKYKISTEQLKTPLGLYHISADIGLCSSRFVLQIIQGVILKSWYSGIRYIRDLKLKRTRQYWRLIYSYKTMIATFLLLTWLALLKSQCMPASQPQHKDNYKRRLLLLTVPATNFLSSKPLDSMAAYSSTLNRWELKPIVWPMNSEPLAKIWWMHSPVSAAQIMSNASSPIGMSSIAK